MNAERKWLVHGEHAPWFRAAALSGSRTYAFDTVAGRHVLLLFFGSLEIPACRRALELVRQQRRLFDDLHACFFGVTVDPRDAESGRIRQELPGLRYFLDYDRRVSALFGAAGEDRYEPYWLLLDPALRVAGSWPATEGEAAFEALEKRLEQPFTEGAWAPVLLVPEVFEPDFCRQLIAAYEADGGEDSGFMRDVNGKTTLILDHSHKKRRDHIVEDDRLKRAVLDRMNRSLNPALQKAFLFKPTRIERYLVACYEAGAGHFRPHRDNTTKGTAHRKFAVTINLNAGEYEGGDLRFPEFGPRTYRAPTGGAIVFSCSLLHEATPVTGGRRYAFLPFLYDEEGAAVREANSGFLSEGSTYRMNAPSGS